ncbi:site-specific integrase [Paenibacillus chondroitinus]|uniref:Site-specific integrase n=1 Tax=Paenibacillus chondroitinus TaxID=59842 RepID=A0ABU6DL05_9BACL|nr:MULTISPECIES: site-specific integrase [Paenibacillus]MCY9657179.1 site-specific integrase [Paenibacillus anseongense]MEB4798462.1 site-specific integrase [Paenibacillus chondroitinus]
MIGLEAKKSPSSTPSFIKVDNLYIQLYAEKHITANELFLFRGKITQSVLDTPFKYYSNQFSDYQDSKVDKAYAYILGFLQRITIPLEWLLQSSVNPSSYPIEAVENFQVFEQLYDKYYPNYYKLDVKDKTLKQKRKKKVLLYIFKLWLAGYALFPRLGRKAINHEVLKQITERDASTQVIDTIRFLSFILYHEAHSLVKEILQVKNNTPLFKREFNKWNNIMNSYPSELTRSIHEYNFNISYLRVNNVGITSKPQEDSITLSSWVTYSASLINFAEELGINQVNTIQEALSHGIRHFLSRNRMMNYSDDFAKNTRIAIRKWLEWLSEAQQLNLNILKIVPFKLSRRTKTFGKLIDVASAHLLIETLLDDHSSYFDENKIFDFRLRRACLIQVATGARGSEVGLLLKDCLRNDHLGTVWLHFHKTKNGNPHDVVARSDVQKWVAELQTMSPSHKIAAPKALYPAGDDLNEFRLFANFFEDGPLTYDGINSFLEKIQHKIWGKQHPNGRAYTSHDLRRIHTLYMRIKGKTKHEIQDQLGQTNVDSQLPYLATKPLAHQQWFKEIAQKGIYKNVSNLENDHEGVTVPLDTVLEQTAKFEVSAHDISDVVKKMIEEQVTTDISPSFSTPSGTLAINQVSAGFPRRTHNCRAHELLNCGHTELHCFSCKKYMPDSDMLNEHKAEVLRYMILTKHNEYQAKKNKDALEKETILIRANDIRLLIKETFHELFKKFDLTEDSAGKIEIELQKKAEIYWRKNGKTKPSLTFHEAFQLITMEKTNA